MMSTIELIESLHDRGFSYAWIADEVGVCETYLYHLRARRKTASSDLQSRLKSLLSDIIEQGIQPERKAYTRNKPAPKQCTKNRNRARWEMREPRREPAQRLPERKVQPAPVKLPASKPALFSAHKCERCQKSGAREYPVLNGWYCPSCAAIYGQI